MTKDVASVLADLKTAIENKCKEMRSLEHRRSEVVMEIQSAFSSLFSALRSREQWLLNHVDLIVSSQGSVIQHQLCLLRELKGLCSQRTLDSVDAHTASAFEKLLQPCLTSTDLAFLGNYAEMRNQLLEFGKISSSKNIQERDSLSMELLAEESGHIDQSFRLSEQIILSSSNKSVKVADNEDAKIPHLQPLRSFRFDFKKGIFVSTCDGAPKEELPSKDETKEAKDSATEQSRPLLPLRFDFKANKFVQVPIEAKPTKTRCQILKEAIKDAESAALNVGVSWEGKHVPVPVKFDFTAGKFVPAVCKEVESRKCASMNESKPSKSSIEANIASDKQDQFWTVAESELFEGLKRAVDDEFRSRLDFDVFPGDTHVQFAVKAFVLEIKNEIERINKAIQPLEIERSESQSPGSFRFDFSAGKFVRVTRDDKCNQSGHKDLLLQYQSGGKDSKFYAAVQDVVNIEIKRALKVHALPEDHKFICIIKKFIEKINKEINMIKWDLKLSVSPVSFSFDFKADKFIPANLKKSLMSLNSGLDEVQCQLATLRSDPFLTTYVALDGDVAQALNADDRMEISKDVEELFCGFEIISPVEGGLPPIDMWCQVPVGGILHELDYMDSLQE